MKTIAETINAHMYALQNLLEGPRKDGLPGPKVLYYGFAGWNDEIARTACQVMIAREYTGVIGLFDPERPQAGLIATAVVTPFHGAIKVEFCQLWQGPRSRQAILLPKDEMQDAGHYRIGDAGIVHLRDRPNGNLACGTRRAQRNLARRIADDHSGRMITFAF
jgi:hypothetical protein